MKKILFLILAILIISSTTFGAEITNEKIRQEGNRVVITYDLKGSEDKAEVSLTITVDGKTYTAEDLHLEGDYGEVRIGKGKRIYWNVLQDFPRGLSTEIIANIEAVGLTYRDPVTGMEFVYVKGGCFEMGCGSWTDDCDSDEEPVHEICVDDFYIGKYEVTQGQWKAVMGSNPSSFKDCGDNCPVENVSWNDVQEFIRMLNKKTNPPQSPLGEGGRKGRYRLPTEAEWEYACRSGGKEEKYAGFSNENRLYLFANFCDKNCEYDWKTSNQDDRYRNTSSVDNYKPNGLGIYDLSGNVWEWVQDWYDSGYYKKSSKWNPKGPVGGTYRVIRGGSWDSEPKHVRCTFRNYAPLDDSYHFIGFRLLHPVK
jgi:formylglycine-generating enzyme required for sulfatase activity